MKILNRKYHSTRKRSKKSETDLAEKLNGKVQPGSGAINRFDLKADVKSAKFLADDKLVGGESFTVKLALWRKISREAWKNNKRPLMRLNFEKGDPLYLMDEVTFMELTNATRPG